MSTGVGGSGTGSLIVQKTERGVAVKGSVPQVHAFPPKFLDRELNTAVRIHVVIPSDPPVVYEVTALEGTRHPDTGALTGPYELVGHLLPQKASEPSPPKKKRWFRRS